MHFKRSFFFACLFLPCWLNAQWIQLGEHIDGVAVDPVHQSPVAMNANGHVAVIGSRNFNTGAFIAGRSQAVQWDGTSWNAMGNPHDGEDPDDWCGMVVSVNEPGTVYAVSCPGEFNAAGEKSGVVRVYEWDGTDWTLRGAPLEGPGSGAVTEGGPWPQFGQSLDMSADGNMLAIGAPHESEDASALDQHGLVQVWMWDGQAWAQRGQDLRGTQNMDFGESVVMSQEGNVLVVGAPLYGSSTEDLGWVQSYQWDGEEWVPMGAPILGSAGSELLGMRLALSANGLTLAVSSPGFGTPNAWGPGLVYVYDWDGNAWIQRGSTLALEDSGYGFGMSLSMQADGNRLAVGALSASQEPFGLQQQGACHVFDWDGADWIPVGEPIWGEEILQFASGMSLSSDGNILGIGSMSALVVPSQVRFFTYATANGLDERERHTTVLHPNPATDQLTIRSSHHLDCVEVLDALGRTHEVIRPNGTSHLIDVSSLTPGIYILRFTTDGLSQPETQRFVKN